MDKASEAILALKPVTFRYKHELDPKGIPQFGLVVSGQRLQPLTEANFRDDVNISGKIDIGDVHRVRLNRGHTLP